MILVEIGNRVDQVKNKLDEITLNEYESVMYFFSKQYDDDFDRYVDIIQALSKISKEEIESLDIDVFTKIINSIQINNLPTSTETYLNEFTFNDIQYKSRATTEFKFKAGEIFKIRKRIESHNVAYITFLAALIFSETSITTTLEERMENLKDIPMSYVLPYLINLSEVFNIKG